MEANQVNEAATVYVTTGKDKPEAKTSEYLFAFQLTKGRIAESLVQELLSIEGYEVTKFGLENLYPGFSKKIRGNKDSTAESVRYCPDLFLRNPCNGQVNYAEVKYRANGKFSINRAKYQFYEERFPNCFFFFVNPTNIYCIPFAELQERKTIDCNKCDEFLLKHTTDFDLRAESVEHFERFVSTFFNEEFLKQSSDIQSSTK
ncbi:hypothetical protein ATO12_17190 [Aquimarina atlantica]|uniref:Restriction endonuclease n=1 Tax=Aquimarina atlantica TaxID=1317122 RepID=A0A023BUJ1_9FLAO|nr:hypothetical protein [Aquimarina atlantica]EZH73671.1 hypothetical protein ATO12_17190 [Aquimarina atlantica]